MIPLGVDFEDHRFASRDEFIALKPSLPFNQVPILEVDGEVFSQSQGLARLAGRLGGLVRRRTVRCVLCTHGSAHTRISQYPEDALEAARVDMITEAVVDLSNGFAKIKYNPALSDEEKVRICLELWWCWPIATAHSLTCLLFQAAAFAKYTAETLPGWIKNVEARIKGDGPFFAGDKVRRTMACCASACIFSHASVARTRSLWPTSPCFRCSIC